MIYIYKNLKMVNKVYKNVYLMICKYKLSPYPFIDYLLDIIKHKIYIYRS